MSISRIIRSLAALSGKTQQRDQKSHIVLRNCNSTSRLNRFITSQNSEPLKGQKLGRAKSANSYIIIRYEDVRGTFGSFVGKYPLSPLHSYRSVFALRFSSLLNVHQLTLGSH